METREVTLRQDPSVPDRPPEEPTAKTERFHPITPAVDVLENEIEYLVFADLPGVRPSDVRIELASGELSLRAPRTGLGATVELVSGQRRFFEYVRRFRLPGGIDANAVSAELSEGILRLRLPKEEALRPRTIPVASG